MRAYWRWVPLPRHTVSVDEILDVLWSDYYGAVLFGEAGEIADLPHKGCRLEVVATAESSGREVNLILPGEIVHYKGSFCFLARFELPSGTTIGLWHLVGFKLRLVPDTSEPVPSEDATLDRALARPEWIRVSSSGAAIGITVAMMSRRVAFAAEASESLVNPGGDLAPTDATARCSVLNGPWCRRSGRAAARQGRSEGRREVSHECRSHVRDPRQSGR